MKNLPHKKTRTSAPSGTGSENLVTVSGTHDPVKLAKEIRRRAAVIRDARERMERAKWVSQEALAIEMSL